MSDHLFSERVAKAFNEIGEYDFSNLVEHQPWSIRSRVIAKQRVYEKYINPEDVYRAIMLQRNTRNTPGTNFKTPYYWGQQYIKEVLEEKSGGTWIAEVSSLMKELPTVFEYAKDYFEIEDTPPEKPTLKIVK